MSSTVRLVVCLALAICWTGAMGRPEPARAAQSMLPEESAAKAKAILQQVITALGGAAYLNAHDSDCSGRVAQFGHGNELMGFTNFRDLWVFPDKNRTEYISKGQNTLAAALLGIDDLSIVHGGVLVTVYNGDHGWTLDKQGVSDQPDDNLKTFAEQVKSGMNNMLRVRMNQEDVEYHYAGGDLIDLKEADWIEFSDRDHRMLRLAVDRSNHLPLRWVVANRDPETRQRSETASSYTQYFQTDGVQTALSVTRSQNGRNVAQIFLTGCHYNSNLSSEMFTRSGLEGQAKNIKKTGK